MCTSRASRSLSSIKYKCNFCLFIIHVKIYCFLWAIFYQCVYFLYYINFREELIIFLVTFNIMLFELTWFLRKIFFKIRFLIFIFSVIKNTVKRMFYLIRQKKSLVLKLKIATIQFQVKLNFQRNFIFVQFSVFYFQPMRCLIYLLQFSYNSVKYLL